MASLTTLVEHYKKKLTPAVQLVVNPGAAGAALTKNLAQRAGVVSASPQRIQVKTNSPAGKVVNSVNKLSETFSNSQVNPFKRYGEEQIAKPLLLGAQQVSQGKTLKDKGLGAFQALSGVFSATPVGVAGNLLTGLAAGTSKSARQNINPYKAIFDSATTPTSFATEGLGINNPLLALGVDVLTGGGDPRSLRALSKLKPQSVKAAFRLEPKTLDELIEAEEVLANPQRYVDRFNYPTPVHREQALQQATSRALETVERLAAKYLPDKALVRASGDPRKLIKELSVLHSQNRLGNVPGMGFASENQSRRSGKAVAGVPDSSGTIQTQKAVAKAQVPGATSVDLPSTKSIANPTEPFYNVKRVGVDEATQQGIKQTVTSAPVKAQIEQIVGKKLSHNEVQKYAQVAKELGKTFTRDEALELGSQAAALRNKVAELAETNLSSDEFTEALIRDKAFGSYLARLFGQRRIISDPAKKTIYNKLIGEILKTGVDPDDVIKDAKGVNFQDASQATAFFRKFVKATKGEWIDKLRYNSMLSSPNTWINNAASNFQGTGILTPVQKTIEGGIDAVVSGLTGRARTRFAGEGIQYAKGYYSNVREAYKNLVGVFKGTNFIENPDIRHVPLATTPRAKKVEAVLDVYTKIQESVDQFFKTLTKGGLEEAYRYRLAKGGKDLSASAVDEANKLLFRGELTEPGAGVISNFIGEGANWVARGTHSKNKSVRWLAKLTVPFIRTGTNVVKAGIEGNPLLGAVNMIGNGDKTAQAAKMVMGGAVMAVGGSLALADRLTFAEPTGEKQRAAFREAGMQPYAVKMGDKWVSYQRLHPLLGFQLATVAAVHDAYKQSKIDENTAGIIAEGLFNSLKFVADQSYFKNIGDFVSTVDGDVEGLSRLASNYPSQFIPSRAMMGWVTRIIDQYQRKPDTDAGFFEKTFQQMATQIPGLSTLVPMREGASGEPITTSLQDRLINAVSPNRVTTDKPDARQAYEDMRQESLTKSNEQIIRDRVEATGEQITMDGKTFYQDGDSIQSFEIPEVPQLTGQAVIDNELKKQYKTSANDVIKGVFTMYNSGQISQSQAQAILDQLTGPGVRYFDFNMEAKRQLKSDAVSQANKEKKEILKQVTDGELAAQEAARLISQIKVANVGSVKVPRIRVASAGRVKRIKLPKLKKVKLRKPKKLKKIRVKKVKGLSRS